jgi:hypothetical protein
MRGSVDLRVLLFGALAVALLGVVLTWLLHGVESKVVERQGSIAALPPEEQLGAVLDDVDRLAASFGVDLKNELGAMRQLERESQAVSAQIEAIQSWNAPEEEKRAAIQQVLAEYEARIRTLARPEAQATAAPPPNPAREPARELPPAWLVAGLVGIGVLSVGGIGAFLLLRGGEEQEEETPESPRESGST